MSAAVNPGDGEVPDDLPILPASGRRGVPGHDQALDVATVTQMIRLKVSGVTYASIAEEFGYADASGARQAILRALHRQESEAVADLRALEDDRIDSVLRTAMTIKDDTRQPARDRLRAAETILRAGKRRADLHGFDAPKQVIISAVVEAELSEALSELREVVLGETLAETVEPYDTPTSDPSQELPPALEA